MISMEELTSSALTWGLPGVIELFRVVITTWWIDCIN
jgi:hypothetical protein